MNSKQVTLKKTSALIVGNEQSFYLGQQILAQQKHTSIIINLSTTTFKIVGKLTSAPIEPLIQVCQEALQTLSFFNTNKLDRADASNTESVFSSRKQSLVERTCEFLRLNLSKPLTIHDICKAMLTNRNSLSQAFKEELNIGVSGWLRQLRMEQAKHLLINTDLSIQEISEQVGYPVQANFSTTFKQHFKQSPIKIRKLGRHNSQ